MENSTEVVSFVLGAYGKIGKLKYLYFSIMLLWYFSVYVANAVLMMNILVDKKLHEPMYLLLGNLLANEKGASTAVYPLTMSQTFSDTHEVKLPWCFLQMCCIYTCASVEFCSLAAMAYDRYVAICCPLQYNVIMTMRKVSMISLFVWMYSFVNGMFSFSFVIRLTYCDNVIDKVFCDHHLIIKLACTISVLNKISDLLFAFVTIVVPFGLISVSYSKILPVCLNLNTSKKNRQNALTTCTPQIASVSNLFVGLIFHFSDSRFVSSPISNEVRIFFSLYVLIFQPMITPFMYGFNLPKIRQSWKRFLLKIK